MCSLSRYPVKGWYGRLWYSAVCVQNSTITFEGETTFDGNSAAVSGGGIFANVSNLTFHGSTTFINNEALERGAGLCVLQSHLKFLHGPRSAATNNLSSNSVGGDGSGLYAMGSIISFTGDSSFANNSVYSGGTASM